MFRRVTTRVLLLLCAMYLITYVDRVNVSTAASQFGAELGLTHTQVGFVFSAFAYPYLVFQIIGGWLGDRFGPRRTLAVCAIIWAGATVLTGLAGGFVSLVIARLLLGLGEGATFPTATRAMSNWTTPERRGSRKASRMRLRASATRWRRRSSRGSCSPRRGAVRSW